MAREPHDGPFEKRAVSSRANSVRNDDPDILFPVPESGLFRLPKRRVERPRKKTPPEKPIDASLLQHVSPIEWDNVLLYGQYVLDRARAR